MNDDTLREQIANAMAVTLDKDQFIRKGVYVADSGSIDRVMQLIVARDEQREKEAYARGKLAAINAFKVWADSTEATYNDMMQSQVSEITTLTNPNQQTGEK